MKLQPLDVSWCKQHVTDISQRAKGQRLQHNYITLQQEHAAAVLACVTLSGRVLSLWVTTETFINPQL